jgi:hypothetical protein
MTPSDKREVLRELNFLPEDYVREKRAIGGYSCEEEQVVDFWLNELERKRQEERRTIELKESRRRTFWATAKGVCGALGFVLVAAFHYLAK